MLAEERRLRIVQTLKQRDTGIVSVAELAQTFSVSSMTIRRDLDWLENNALLKRVHGGAVANRPLIDEAPFRERGSQFSDEKRSIGWMAAQLVGDGEQIILDAGTTTQQIAQNLSDRKGLTAVTNALPVATVLALNQHCSTIILGGMLKEHELCVVGPSVASQLAHLSVDKLFLSASGFSLERGITDSDFMEVAVKQARIKATQETILVADSSKWNVVTLVQIAALAAIDRLVTDDGLPGGAIAAIEAEGIEVITPARYGLGEAAVLASTDEQVFQVVADRIH